MLADVERCVHVIGEERGRIRGALAAQRKGRKRIDRQPP